MQKFPVYRREPRGFDAYTAALFIDLIESNPASGPGERYDQYLLRRFDVLDPMSTSIRDEFPFDQQRWYIQDEVTGERIGQLLDGERPVHQDGYSWIITRQ